jgi:hypothetical protein
MDKFGKGLFRILVEIFAQQLPGIGFGLFSLT